MSGTVDGVGFATCGNDAAGLAVAAEEGTRKVGLAMDARDTCDWEAAAERKEKGS